MAQHTFALLPEADGMDIHPVSSDFPRKETLESGHGSLVEERRTVGCCRTQVWAVGVLDTLRPGDSLGNDYCRRHTALDIEGNRS
jgi:hypothetical protein